METQILRSAQNLGGRVALVTGVSRRSGIGFGIAKRLTSNGADLFLQSFASYDKMFSSIQSDSHETVLKELRELGNRVELIEADFMDTESPARVMKSAVATFGHVDILVINHVHDSLKTLDELTADEIDKHLLVNVRATLLLVQEFAKQHNGRAGGRIIMLTSGQHLGPMPHMAYVASKGALHQLTWSLSDYFIAKSITVNTVNPGPTKTYEPTAEVNDWVMKHMPQGRWGEPDDAGRLVAWLASDDARWITGQVINSEGGVRAG
jgi:3-oxoacyl-[acyl-carrier protein] reductase